MKKIEILSESIREEISTLWDALPAEYGNRYQAYGVPERAAADFLAAINVDQKEEVLVDCESPFARGFAVSQSHEAIGKALVLWAKMAIGQDGGWVGTQSPPEDCEALATRASNLLDFEEVKKWISEVKDIHRSVYSTLQNSPHIRSEELWSGVLLSWEGQWTGGRWLKIFISRPPFPSLKVALSWDTGTGFPSSWLELPDIVEAQPELWEEFGELKEKTSAAFICPHCGSAAFGQPEKEILCQCGTRFLEK